MWAQGVPETAEEEKESGEDLSRSAAVNQAPKMQNKG